MVHVCELDTGVDMQSLKRKRKKLCNCNWYACFHSQFPRLNLTKQRMEQIQPKMLTKHVLRLMEKFKIDKGGWLGACFVHAYCRWMSGAEIVVTCLFGAGLCPNALHKRRLDSLRFLMYKRFVEVSDGADVQFYFNVIIFYYVLSSAFTFSSLVKLFWVK